MEGQGVVQDNQSKGRMGGYKGDEGNWKREPDEKEDEAGSLFAAYFVCDFVWIQNILKEKILTFNMCNLSTTVCLQLPGRFVKEIIIEMFSKTAQVTTETAGGDSMEVWPADNNCELLQIG